MKRRVLLVDDNLIIRKVLQAFLVHEGFEIITAIDGEQVLQRIAEHHAIDLIVMDVKMPKLDGLQVCKVLKTDPRTAKIPVILFTASATSWVRLVDQCIELGIAGWLKKPFEPEELLEQIDHALGKREGPDG